MKFAVVAAKRTGSSHFVNLLSAHPDIFCHGNVFKSGTMPVLWPPGLQPDAREEKQIKAELSELRDRAPQEFLARIFAMNHGKESVGFKIFWNQNNEILDELIADHSVRKVVLFRDNVLANFASAKSAASSNTWSLKVDQDTAGWEEVTFHKKDFLSFYKSYMSFYRRTLEQLNSQRAPYIIVNYNEINDPLLISSVINFIGGDPNKPIVPDDQPRQQVKQGPPTILSRFENKDDVRKFLARKGLNHFRREGEVSLETVLRDV